MNNKSHVSFFVSLLKEAFHNGLKRGGNGARQKKSYCRHKIREVNIFFCVFLPTTAMFPLPENSKTLICTLIYGLLLNHIKTPEFALFIFDFTKFLLYCKKVKKKQT